MMMDYENIKAMIEARRKQWHAQAERARNLQAEYDVSDSMITALDASVTACDLLLRDMQTAYDIYQAQVRGANATLPAGTSLPGGRELVRDLPIRIERD